LAVSSEGRFKPERTSFFHPEETLSSTFFQIKEEETFWGQRFCFFYIQNFFCAVMKLAKHVKSIPIDIN